MRILLRLDEPNGSPAHGNRRDLFTMSASDLYKRRRGLQLMFQCPTQLLNPRTTVYQLITDAWVIHARILSNANCRNASRRVAATGRAETRDDPRLAASVLRRNHSLIIYDEAGFALDVSVPASAGQAAPQDQNRLSLDRP